MKDMLYAGLAVVSGIIGAFLFYTYISQGDDAEKTSMLPFIGAIIFFLITLALGGLFLSGRVNKTEDIHVTE